MALTGAASIVFTAGASAATGSGRVHRHKAAVRRGVATASANSGGAGLSGPVATSAPGVSVSTPAHPVVPGTTAKIIHGVAYAPADAPIQVQRAIWAGDAIRLKPYVYGGGHGVWNDVGYDCSGSVSYVLHAAGLIKVSMDSSQYMSWGESGEGEWVTVYSNPGHAFVDIAGIRLDTSAEGDPRPAPGSGPRWRPLMRNTGGYTATHPADF
jgi:cell wall-associated NlpC family hydrolase